MRQYKLHYWPGSGDGPALTAEQIKLRFAERIEHFTSESDWTASQHALAVGLRFNSDGVELLRLDARGIMTQCYIARADQPEIMSEGDLIP